jgi:hypothetical protein
MQERRKEQRWPAYLGARIIFAGRQTTADCVVRNTSAGGARLVVHRAALLPDEFCLQIPKRQVELKVRTRWRRQEEVGIEMIPVAVTEPVDLEVVRRMRELEASNETLKRRLVDLTEAST